LQQVVWNLLTNAVKFTPEGGRVEVRLERADAQAIIIVSDSGIGISHEFLPYVFDRFRQADSTSTRSYGGLGLGLSLVRHLVELHDGTVQAESGGEGLGSTFKVGLPLLTVGVRTRQVAALESGEACAGDPAATILNGLRVLVVDDEQDAREMLQMSLSKCGAEVNVSATASQALASLQEFKPDVLISDIGMSGEDGYTLIRQVRALPIERGGRTPAVALTAYAREDDRRRVLAAGFQLHISKPVDPQKLATLVASLAGRNA
jgi:CheY-like chemotaxis protein